MGQRSKWTELRLGVGKLACRGGARSPSPGPWIQSHGDGEKPVLLGRRDKLGVCVADKL